MGHITEIERYLSRIVEGKSLEKWMTRIARIMEVRVTDSRWGFVVPCHG